MFVYDSADNEKSFSEAYRSQILNPESDSDDDESSKGTLIIIILVVVALALGIFGYMYLSKDNQTQTVKVDSVEAGPTESNNKEEIAEAPPESNMLNNIDELLLEEDDNSTEAEAESESIKIEEESPKVDEVKKIQVKSLSKQKGEDTYLEQLAELSKEIDGDKK